jgi:hypothetical protein
MSDRTIKRLLSVAVLAAAAGLYGCASSTTDQDAAVISSCQGTSQQDCEARDNARQLRDAADYKDEPALGYLRSPPGLLPVPLTSRNTSSN